MATTTSTIVPGRTTARACSLEALRVERETLRCALSAASGTDEDVLYDRFVSLQMQILTGPINQKADALAKIRVAAESFEDGNLGDKSDVLAIAAAVAWLEASR